MRHDRRTGVTRVSEKRPIVQVAKNQPEWEKKLDNLVSPRLRLVLSRLETHAAGRFQAKKLRGYRPSTYTLLNSDH